MDKDTLVSEGQKLVQWLDDTKVKPRGALWVYSSDTDSWRLWIVPAQAMLDKVEFYRTVAEVISKHRDSLPSLDVGLVEIKEANHPAVQGLGRLLRMEGVGAATFTDNLFNGFFMPDGVVLRMAI